eukprot:395293-Prorocentrum_minimum.AAC.1
MICPDILSENYRVYSWEEQWYGRGVGDLNFDPSTPCFRFANFSMQVLFEASNLCGVTGCLTRVGRAAHDSRKELLQGHVHGVMSDGQARFPGGGGRPREVRGGVAQEVAGRGPVGGG